MYDSSILFDTFHTPFIVVLIYNRHKADLYKYTVQGVAIGSSVFR